MTAVMQGVRILEVAEHTFVPAASALLADWGAEVIKVEHVERGDAMRGLASSGTRRPRAAGSTSCWSTPTGASRASASTSRPRTGLDDPLQAGRHLRRLPHQQDAVGPHEAERRRRRASGPPTRTSSTCGGPARASGAPTPTRARTTRWPTGTGPGWPWARSRPTRTTSPAAGPGVRRLHRRHDHRRRDHGRAVPPGAHRRGHDRRRVAPGHRHVVDGRGDGALPAARRALGAAAEGRQPQRQPAGRQLPDEGRPLRRPLLPAAGQVLARGRRGRRAARAGRRRALRRRRRDPGQRRRRATSSWPRPSPSARSTSGGSALADFSGQWAIVQNTLEAAADPQAVANGYISELETSEGVPVPAGDRRRCSTAASPPQAKRAPEFNEHGDAILEGARPRLGHDRGPQGPRRRRLRPGAHPSPSSPRPTSGSGPRAPTAACASSSATTARRWSTRRSRSARRAAAARGRRPRCRATATVVGFTVNQHQWHPAFEPPYAIANVALAEDPTVHLTTNVVGCEPDEVHIGQEVQVRFEQAEDVWLPLFEPTGRTDPSDRVPEPRAPDAPGAGVRRPLRAPVVLSGVGRSAIGRRLMRDPLSLAVDACLAAVEDAGLALDDIDGLSTYPGPGPHGDERGRRHRRRGGAAPAPDLDQRRRRPARARRLGHRRDAGGGRRPVPPRPLLPDRVGVDLRRARPAPAAAAGGSRGRWREWRMPFGAISAANWIAMNANQYLHRYGADREVLGWIALNDRANAARNPAAIYRDPMTMDDYLSARPITTPVRALRLRRPVRRLDRGDRVRRVGRRRPAQARHPGRGRRHPDPGADLLGPGHHHPRAAGPRPVGPPLDRGPT